MEDCSRRGLLAAVGTALAAGCTALPGTDRSDGSTADTATPSSGSAGAGAATPSDVEGPYARVYERTIGSVVRVRVTTESGTGGGSGFVHRSGHLVTNEHVVAPAGDVQVGFRNGEWREATVEGTDVYSDLAVLSVDDRPSYAEPLPLVRADPPVGTRVLALGNPFEFEASASAGIVSGLDRSLRGANNFPIPDTVQTDVAVNPGNSGGPLVDLDGKAVGVVSATGGENLAFAISAPLARRVVPALVEDGEYDHPYVGVSLQTVTPTVAEVNDLPLENPRGVLVVAVRDGTPADGVLEGSPEEETRHGQRVGVGGDVLLAVGDTPTPSLDELTATLALETSPGQTVEFEILRDGEHRTVSMELDKRPPP